GAAAGGAALAVLGGLLLMVQPAADTSPPDSPRLPETTLTVVEYTWPTGESGEVRRPFAAPPDPWAAGHRGVDLALPDGAAVLAAADGVVAYAGSVAGRGVVSVDHDDGVRTTYEPVAAVVGRGTSVRRGDVL